MSHTGAVLGAGYLDSLGHCISVDTAHEGMPPPDVVADWAALLLCVLFCVVEC